jgi:hypothetical protein
MPPKIIKAHQLTAEEARDLLENHVRTSPGDPDKVEMPLETLQQRFDISYPLNITAAKGNMVVNGFNRLTQPPMANFYLTTLAREAGISSEEARALVTGNGVSFDRQNEQQNQLTR